MLNPLARALHQLPHDVRQFGANDRVFHADDPVHSLHLVNRGEVHLIRHQIGGATFTLQRAMPGAILAEASLFSERYHCDAMAVQPTQTLCFAKSTIRAELARNASLAENLAVFLAREVQSARLRAEILALRTVAERLEAWVALNGGTLPAKGEWKTVATEIGVSPEALYREFARRRRSTGR